MATLTRQQYIQQYGVDPDTVIANASKSQASSPSPTGSAVVSDAAPSQSLTRQQYMDQYGVDPESVIASSEASKPVAEQRSDAEAAGKPVSVNPNRVQPTLAGRIVRGIVGGAEEAGLTVARGTGLGNLATGQDAYDKGLGAKSNYLGQQYDILTNINNKSDQLGSEVRSGDITLPRALASSVADSALQTVNTTAPFELAGGVGELAVGGLRALASGGADAAADAATTAGEQAPSTLNKIVSAGKNVAKGAAIGYGYDVANNVSNEENNTAGSILKPGAGAAIGAIVPAAIEGGAEGISAAKSAISTPDQIDSLEQTYKNLGEDQAPRKASKFANAQAATVSKDAAGTTGRTPQRVLAENGIIPKITDSKLDTAGQADEFRAATKPLKDTNREALAQVEKVTAPIKLDDLENAAVAKANTPYNVNQGTAADLERQVREEFANLRKAYPSGEIPITTADDIKSARWNKVPFNSVKPLQNNANYLVAKSAQEAIMKTAADAGFDDVAQLNRHIGDRLEASKFLEDLDGRKLKHGGLNKLVFEGVGASVGHSPLGKILGAVGGNQLADLLMSNEIAGPVKRLMLMRVEEQSPEAFKNAVQYINDQKANAGRVMSYPDVQNSKVSIRDFMTEVNKKPGLLPPGPSAPVYDALPAPKPGAPLSRIDDGSVIHLPAESPSTIANREQANIQSKISAKNRFNQSIGNIYHGNNLLEAPSGSLVKLEDGTVIHVPEGGFQNGIKKSLRDYVGPMR